MVFFLMFALVLIQTVVIAIGTLKWKFKVGWCVFSSPAIGADGTIYVGSGDDRIHAIQN